MVQQWLQLFPFRGGGLVAVTTATYTPLYPGLSLLGIVAAACAHPILSLRAASLVVATYTCSG